MTDEKENAKKFWPSYDLVFFDCDSTLTSVEGIDELARLKGKGWRVSVLTDKAMDGKLDLEEVYERRLRAIYPTREQVRQIAQVYGETKVPDAGIVIQILQRFNREARAMGRLHAEGKLNATQELFVAPRKPPYWRCTASWQPKLCARVGCLWTKPSSAMYARSTA